MVRNGSIADTVELGNMPPTIRLRKNGPFVIEDELVKVVDWNGAEYPIVRRPIALCRCGSSMKKPFCDGSHARVGFEAATGACGPEAGEDPAS
jgi:CDGSH-type Zn-finger protein